ncbi:MAG: hypothetical protein U1F59_00885 [Candidatus Competibacteraceae bacterium]
MNFASRALLFGFLILAAGPLIADPAHSPVLPDPQMTPGDVLTTDAAVICVPGYTKTVRDVPQSVKNQVYRQYGVISREPREYEVDHLISLELGGSNSIRNLWPQSYVSQPLNAHVKDRLENKLHDLICAGKVSVDQAQKEIAEDWTKAYVKYVGSLPGGAVTPAIGNSAAPSAPMTSPPPAIAPTVAGAPGNPDGSCPATAPIKVSRSGIYHQPTGDPNYAATKAKACFATPQAAEHAGYRAPRR